jgi:Trk K+ transport system NAD-binding subunit
MEPYRRAPRRDLRTLALFVWTIVRGFKLTLTILGVALLVGTILFRITPHGAFGGKPPPLMTCAFSAWLALFAQPILSPPETWYLALLGGVYPLLGFGLVGEGVVRLGVLMLSRARGEKEWMRVMASTYRDHIVLCGLGHLGYRILGALLATEARVVCIEKQPDARFLEDAKATGVPILVRDMKEDQALLDAGIEHAHTVIIATNDDMANIEVALDSRRFNPRIRVIMRLFDQQIADKVKDAFLIEEAFSSAALAAPIVAAMAHGSGVLASFRIAGIPHVTAELAVEDGSALCGRTIGDIERDHGARVLAHTAGGAEPTTAPRADVPVHAGDKLVVHARLPQVNRLAVVGRRSGRTLQGG